MIARRIIIAVVLILTSGSCRLRPDSASTSHTGDHTGVRLWAPNTGLSLVAIPIVDSLRVGDSARVAVLIRNTGTPVTIRNDPSYYSFLVLNPTGQRILAAVSYYEAPDLGTTPTVMLPHNGLIGDVFNLACARPPFDPIRSVNRCMWRFSLTDPGKYRVVAHYRVPHVRTGKDGPSQAIDLESDTVFLSIIQRSR